MKWQNVINALIGIWLIISAFLKLSAGGNMLNYLIFGIVILILSVWAGSGKRA